MEAPARPLVLLHGFTQTGVSWRPVVERLPEGTRVRCPDLPGHGDRAAVHTNLVTGAALVAHDLTEPSVVVGYSMGGRLALRLALDHPDRVAGLVLVGATAGIDDPGERRARHDADEALAARIEQGGVAGFLDDWLSQPLFAHLRVADDDLVARLANPPTGLASALRLAGTATMDPPWWDELRGLVPPTLVVWGQRDRKFAALGGRLADAIGPRAQRVELPDVGHAAHLEDPDRFAEVLVAFARSLEPA